MLYSAMKSGVSKLDDSGSDDSLPITFDISAKVMQHIYQFSIYLLKFFMTLCSTDWII